MRARLRSDEQEKLNSNEMMVKLAELWKSLCDDRKKKFYDQADQEKLRYITELNDFYHNFPSEVIQNKTKKNHIKKPCSAYALFLKEMKVVIKGNSPDLKMADILKVVAVQWRNLTDERRIIFQRKAQIEKELAKAKMSDSQNSPIEEPVKSKKTTSPKKKGQLQKRTRKSTKTEKVKIEQTVSSKTKIENNDLKFEEPPIIKQQITNVSLLPIHTNFNNMLINTNPVMNMSQHPLPNFTKPFSYFDSDLTLPDLPFFSQSFNKVPSQDPLLSKFSSKDECLFTRDVSHMWSFHNEPFVAKKTNDLIDLLNFHSVKPESYFIKKEDDFSDSDDETLLSTASNLTPCRSDQPISTRNAFNNVLMSALDQDFCFEPLNLDDNFDTYPEWK
jgi:hypothetical protein